MIYPPVAVMFDWCNTLVRKEKVDRSIMEDALKLAGHHDIDLSSVARGSEIAYLQHLLGEKWLEVKESYERMVGGLHAAQQWPTSENALELLALLRSRNISTGIVSNKDGESLRREVKQSGLSEYFSVIIGSGDTPEDKPSPVPIIAALEILGIPPSKRVFFVGDSISDIKSAKRAKCLPIAYDNCQIKGVLSFNDFKDLGNFVEGLLN